MIQAAKVQDPKTPEKRPVGRQKKRTPDISTYSGRVAARLAQLRADAGLTAEQFAEKMALQGWDIAKSSVFAYESGRLGGGADIPPDYYPAVAAVYGFKTAHGWLPAE